MKIHKLLGWMLLGQISLGCVRPSAAPEAIQLSSGTIERLEEFPSVYIPPRNIDIWLPDGYDSNQQYAVLYMHDGQMLFDSTTTWNDQEWGVDETLGKLQKEGTIKNTLVVGIWNGGAARHAEYFPEAPFMELSQDFRDALIQEGQRAPEQPLFSTDVYSDKYLKFIVEELKPYIDEHYTTLSDPDHTFIAGSSMGGLISWYALCEYPQVFGGAACLSTHWPGIFTMEDNPIPSQFFSYLQAKLPSPTAHKLYFDFGTETLDSLYEPLQLMVDTIVASQGYDEQNFLSLKFQGDDHSEQSWQNRLSIPLRFLLAK
jgi:hypothetical protein